MEADSEDATSQSLLNPEYDQLIGGEDEIAATARTTGWQVSNNLTTKREEQSKKEKFKKERKQSSHHNNSKDKENRRIH